MFTRNSTAEPKKLEPLKSNAGPSLNTPPQSQPQAQPQRRQAAPAEAGAKSVIGNDLKIIGQGLKIISQGTLQVDGEVEGDVGGSEVIIGEKGKVTGTVAAERVIVRGQICGVIRGVSPGGCGRAQSQSGDRRLRPAQAELSRQVARGIGARQGRRPVRSLPRAAALDRVHHIAVMPGP